MYHHKVSIGRFSLSAFASEPVERDISELPAVVAQLERDLDEIATRDLQPGSKAKAIDVDAIWAKHNAPSGPFAPKAAKLDIDEIKRRLGR